MGDIFLFSLKEGNIVGGGYFVRSERMSASSAWNEYGERNGFSSKESMEEGINKILKKEFNQDISCIILKNISFIERDGDGNIDYSKAIYIRDLETTNRGVRIYDSKDPTGAAIYNRCIGIIKPIKN